jgi:hypothetical protein
MGSIKPRPAPARNGKDSPAPAADGSLKEQFPAAPDKAPSPAGWKKRRTAAERRADGSYRTRDRKAPTLDR